MKFDMITVDQPANTKDTVSGKIILSRDRYNLDLGYNIVWFNGVTSWSYLTHEKEVTISKPDRKDNSFMSKPSAIFSMYKTGYKCRLIEETAASYIIDLYPEDLNSDMVRVRLAIGKEKPDLRYLEYKKKDGVTVLVNVLSYDLTGKPGPEAFIYNPEKFKGVEIIDIR
jgi:outer membrane lipoprotein carrier protein